MLFDVQGVNGTRYCEWIVNVYDCEDGEFFFTLQVFGTIACFLSTALLLCCAMIRVVGLQYSLKSFLIGTNMPFLTLMIMTLCLSIYSLLVVLHVNPVAIYIIWSIMYPSTLIPPVLFVDMLKQGLCTAKRSIPFVETDIRHCAYSDQHRKTILLGLSFLCMIINFSLISTAAALAYPDSDKENPISHKLITAALIIYMINMITVQVIFNFVCRDMLKYLKNALDSIAEIGITEPKQHTELFQLTIQKVNQMVRQSMNSTVITFVYFIMLVSYDGFFTNIYCSKALAVINIGFIPASYILLGIFYLFNDGRRWLHKMRTELSNELKHRSSDKSGPESRVHSAGVKQASKEDNSISAQVNLDSREIVGS